MKSTLTGVVKRVIIKPNKTDGILNYDEDNAYPQRVLDIINSSGTGTLCTDLMAKFIYGNGFKDKTLGKLIVNKKGLTANQLLRKLSKSIAQFYGFNVHVNYSIFPDTKVSELNFSDFQEARLTNEENKDFPNQLAIYNDWQRLKKSSIDKKNLNHIHFFNPLKVKEEINALKGVTLQEKVNNYKGQILYWTNQGIQYTLAPSDSVLEDIITDAKSKNFKNRNISTNFMASHILEVDEFEAESDKDAFIQNLTKFQGDDEASQIFLLEKAAGQSETGFKLTKVDIQDVDKLYEYTETSVQRNIIRNYLIPSVLLDESTASLGAASGVARLAAYAEYNENTSEYRDVLAETFATLLKGFNGTNFTDFSIDELKPNIVAVKDTIEGKANIVEVINSNLDDNSKRKVFKTIYELSDDEITNLLPPQAPDVGVVAIDKEAESKAQLRGSVGGVTGILALQTSVSQGITSRESALGVLEVIFGLSNLDAKRILGDVVEQKNPNIQA